MMDKVIVAFESEKSCRRIKEILENSGTASCIVCRSADQVKRAVHKQHLTTVVCGYKFSDGSAEELFEDLPPSCAMLLVAVQSILDLCRSDGIFKLAAPVPKGELAASVRMLLQMGRRLEQFVRPRRSEEEQAVIEEAKALLMERHGMTEEQAHRLLQKRSMDSGARMIQTAQLVLEEL